MECFVAVSMLALVVHMAPKKASDGGGKKRKPEAECVDVSDAQDKTNMVNQLKAARKRLQSKTSFSVEEDQAKSELLESYCKLSLRDPKKNEILKKWLGDKSCAWWATYSEQISAGRTTSSESFDGYGTKPLVSIYNFAYVVFVYISSLFFLGMWWLTS